MHLQLVISVFCFLWHGGIQGELTGDNVCHFAENENKQVNTTYLQAAQVKSYHFCLTQITFRCAEYKTVMETRWKMENISRIVMRSKCCAGYKEYMFLCIADCTSPCINGDCIEPETCKCSSGFSGQTCEVMGCEGGRWGPDCKNECACQHGGFCHPVHGGCSCTPGYHGVRCQEKCIDGFYGTGCEKKCSCKAGTTCNHVTGECVPCQPGTFGDRCSRECSCSKDGTELCSAKDGKCFCKENRFGLQCELSCPFGYINNTCYEDPINEDSCQCSNHLFTCDLELGCVCPADLDCGVQQQHEVLEVASLSDAAGGGDGATIAIVSLLVVVLVAVILIVVYYRRRMRVLKTDLENRSVRYTQNPYSGHTADLVIHDNLPPGDPARQYSAAQHQPAQQFSSAQMYPSVPLLRQNNATQQSGDFLNNQLSLASQQQHMASRTNQPENSREKREKNTNIDNFKLGLPEEEEGCSKLRVDLPGCNELRVDLPGCSEQEAWGACAASQGCQATVGDCDQDLDLDPVRAGEGSGILHADVNLLTEQIQNEKAMKPSLSLTFKNNIARTSGRQEKNAADAHRQTEMGHAQTDMCGSK